MNVRLLLSIVAGAFLAFAYHETIGWWFVILGWGIFFCVLLQMHTRKEVLQYTFLSMWIFFAGSLYWILPSIVDFGGVAWGWALAGYGIFCALLTLPYVLLLGLIDGVRRKKLRYCAVMVPIALTGSEWIRGGGVLDFGWNSPAYALVDSWWSGWAPIGGEPLVNFLFFLCVGCIGAIFFDRRLVKTQRWALFGIVFFVLGMGVYSQQYHWSRPQQTIHVRVLQPFLRTTRHVSIEQNRTRLAQLSAMLEDKEPKIDLLLFPESVVTVPIEYAPLRVWQQLQYWGQQSPIMFTALRKARQGIFNTRIFLHREEIAFVDKRRLVPFGEFVPAYLAWLPKLFGVHIGNMQEGRTDQRYFRVKDEKIAPLICYENLYGTLWPSWIQAQGMPSLVTVSSNLGWFGPLILSQHLQMTRFRAMEVARPAVSVNNNGASAWVGPRGQILARLTKIPAVVDWNVITYQGAKTPYVRLGLGALGCAMILYLGLLCIIVSPKRVLFLRRKAS